MNLIKVAPNKNIPDPTVYGTGKNYHIYIPLELAIRLDSYLKRKFPNMRARSLVIQQFISEGLDREDRINAESS